MHVVIVTVNIAAGQFEASRSALQKEVAPRVSKSPGFVRGYWTVSNDKTQGLSFVVFRTQQDAENAAKMVRSSRTPAGVTIASAEVREIVAEGEGATAVN